MPKTFNYTDEELENPLGNNDLSARALFYQRSLYREAIYPQNIMKPLDTWYDKNLFGRINEEQYTVVPHLSKLVEIPEATGAGIHCLNFVQRAFSDLASHMKTAYISNCVNRDGNPDLFNMRAHFAYTDPMTKYVSYLDALGAAYINAYNDSPTDPITNFADFKKKYIKYLEVMAERFPITMSSFLLSTMASPFISGLKIAISTKNAGDDAAKYDDFIRDPNFSYYVAAAKKYGFIVDKNMPWVLTADLFSDAILSYMALFWAIPGFSELSWYNFFYTYYTKTYVDDMDHIDVGLKRTYLGLLEISPYYEAEKIIYDKNCPNPFRKEIGIRAELGLSGTAPGLSIKESIDLYSFLRHAETEGGGGPSLKSVRRRAYEAQRVANVPRLASQPLQLINNAYRKFLYPANYGQINLGFSVDTSIQTDILDTALDVALATRY